MSTYVPRFWLSYADDEGFRGVIVTEADDLLSAVAKVGLMGISPGGEVYGCVVTAAMLRALDTDVRIAFLAIPLDVLLSREVLEAMPGLEARSLGALIGEIEGND